MGIITRLLARVGFAAPPLRDQGRWERATREAVATVIDGPSLRVFYMVNGGLGENRWMRVRAEAPCTGPDALDQLADRIEKAVAPALVGFPIRHACLALTVTCARPDPQREIFRVIPLDELAAKFGLK